MDLRNLSSNWKKLQAGLKSESGGKPQPAVPNKLQHGVKRKRLPATSIKKARIGHNEKQNDRQTQGQPIKRMRKMSDIDETVKEAKDFVVKRRSDEKSTNKAIDQVNEGLRTGVEIGKYVAIDCEMVGVGPNSGKESALARISIVNYNGDQVYDSYVRPQEDVTDWRTPVSGILPEHMRYARSFEEVQKTVAEIIKDRIVVGHSVRNDFDALLLSHPKRDIRDTAKHQPFRQLAGGGWPKLKVLVSDLLGLDIQAGEHSSVEDARATMLLFRRDKDAFEREHARKWPARSVPQSDPADDNTNSKKPTKKKKKKKR